LPLSDAAIDEAARLVRDGGAVAVPTETVYGLAADATSDAAVAGIYAAKGRPSFNPLIVHVADVAMARTLVELSPLAEALAAIWWPGSLTMVLPLRAGNGIAAAVPAGLPTLAIRVPAHAAMRALIARVGRPLAAPSANRSGGISPTTAGHVAASLGSRVPLILDGGATTAGLESTIVAPEDDHVRLLRPGPVTAAMIEAAVGVKVRVADGGAIEAPGQLASHYAPGKPLRLGATGAHADEYLIGFGPMVCDMNLSESGDLEEAAARLFAALHDADASVAARIAVAAIPEDGIGAAINDRLRRAEA
jgi:L-threonylcarbamoyladenylate synthase